MNFCRWFCFSAAVALTMTVDVAKAEDVPETALAKVVHLADDTADHLCGEVNQAGAMTKEKVKGDMNASLSGLAKALSKAGLSGQGELENEHFEGVVQDQLAATLNNTQKCKVEIAKLILEAYRGSAVVQRSSDCPPGETIIESNTFDNNVTAISAPAGVQICIVHNSMSFNGKALELTAPQK